MVEQLPGAREVAEKYQFKHHHKGEELIKLEDNPSGAARGEPYKDRKPLDMFSWLASKHRKRPDFYSAGQNPETEVQIAAARRATSLDLPYAMRFRHLAKNAKEAVGVYRYFNLTIFSFLFFFFFLTKSFFNSNFTNLRFQFN